MTQNIKYKLTRQDYRQIVDYIENKYKISFSQHAYSITKRRIEDFFAQYNVTNLSMLKSFLEKEKFFVSLWEYLQIPTTELFRDYEVWQKIQKKLFPKFSSQDTISIWLPEITTDDELYTILILLKENELLDKTNIYISSELQKQDSIVRNQKISQKKYQASKQNYEAFSKEGNFKQHFSIAINNTHLKKEYFDRVDFFKHSFSKEESAKRKFDLVLFRNRMLNFSPLLQKTSLDIIYDAMKPKGYLIIGLKETIQNWTLKNKFSTIDKDFNIFQKKK